MILQVIGFANDLYFVIMKRLLKYLTNYKKECVIAPLFKMLEALLELLVPLVVASIVDEALTLNDGAALAALLRCLILVGLALIGLLSSVTAQYFAAKAAIGFSKELRHDVFAKLMSFSFSQVDNVGNSAMITRITSDVMQTQNGVNMFLRLFLRSPFVVFGAMIMAFTIDAQSALIFVVVIIILFIIVGFITVCNIPILKDVQKKLDTLSLIVNENISGARVLRAFGMESGEKERFYNQNETMNSVKKKAGFISSLLNPLTYISINIATIVLIYVGALRVNMGVLSQGQIIALYNYMGQILVELVKLANLIVTLNKALASGARIVGVLEIDGADKFECGDEKVNAVGNGMSGLYEKVNEHDNLIVLKHATLKYHNDSDEAVDDVSFEIKRGEVFGIIGGTGSGKSTMLRMIAGYYAISGGSVTIGGIDIDKLDKEAYRRSIGFAMQDASYFAGTIRDHFKLSSLNVSDDEIIEALITADAYEFVKDKGGLDAMVNEGAGNFSGGQKQRLNIARAIVGKPEILLMDDVTSALDYATEAKVLANLRGLAYNPTVVIVSQRASTVLKADRIAVLDDGCLVGIGTNEELLAACEVYREIYYTQFPNEEVCDEE